MLSKNTLSLFLDLSPGLPAWYVLLWASPYLAVYSWAPGLSSQCDFQPQRGSTKRHEIPSVGLEAKNFLVCDPFHSKNVIYTIWLNGVASWFGQWVTEDVLVFPYLSQLREKAKLRHTEDWRVNPYKHLHMATNPSLANVCAKLVCQAVSIVLQNVDEGRETDGL